MKYKCSINLVVKLIIIKNYIFNKKKRKLIHINLKIMKIYI